VDLSLGSGCSVDGGGELGGVGILLGVDCKRRVTSEQRDRAAEDAPRPQVVDYMHVFRKQIARVQLSACSLNALDGRQLASTGRGVSGLDLVLELLSKPMHGRADAPRGPWDHGRVREEDSWRVIARLMSCWTCPWPMPSFGCQERDKR
jgi:hypothetical protein